jgi:DNA-binding MarR family transcriptional regulator
MSGRNASRGAPIHQASPTFEELARKKARTISSSINLDVLTVWLNIVRISNLLIQDVESRVHRPSGWTWAGFRVMFAVLVTGGAQPRDVARLAGVSKASVSGVLNTLERDGWVVRERKAEDRRVVTVRLTDRGRRAAVEAFKQNHLIEKAWLATFSAAEIKTLIAFLHRLHSPYKPAQHAGSAKRRVS